MAATAKATFSISIAIVFAAPASADWFANGNFEPDNPYDSADWMWQDAPAIGESKLYFYVMSASQQATVSGKPAVNPNVGALHTQIEPAGSERHTAWLGVWKDCNGDGYVGMAETAVREYAASLLSSTVACPASTGPVTTWAAGAHNYNGWVSEFVSLSVNVTSGVDVRVYRDDDIQIWGDFHRPDERPFHRSCALNPQPRGTFETTGGFLNYFDCRVDLLGNWNAAMAVIGDPLGLSFADPDDARSGPIGRFWLFGPDSSEHAAVHTVDCSQGTRAGDVINSTSPEVGALGPNLVHNAVIYEPAPSLGPAASDPASFSLAGQFNVTNEEWNGDCDMTNDRGDELADIFEADFNGVNPNNKTEADWNFGFITATRGAAPFSAIPGMNGASGIPGDGGLGVGGTRWLADSTWLSKPGPRTARIDLANGGVEIAPAYWLTFYAQLGQATLDRGFGLPGSGAGTYGSWHCGANVEGIHNGWNCDADLWYINPDGSFPPATTLASLAKPGWTYHLRDVDCYDGRIGDLDIGVTPAYYGAEPCP